MLTLDQIKNMTPAQAIARGMVRWNKESGLYLIPLNDWKIGQMELK